MLVLVTLKYYVYPSTGMVYLDQWGPLRHAANVAFICLQVCIDPNLMNF